MKIKAWGEEYEVEFRLSEYHGPGGVIPTEEPLHLAEIKIGSYPYAGWGVSQSGALRSLCRRIEKAEAIYQDPPDNTTDWHRATMEVTNDIR